VICVVDASVVVKLLFPEPGSAALRRIVADGAIFIAPDLIIPEACTAAWVRHRGGRATADQVQDMPFRLREVLSHVVPSTQLATRAAEIALLLDHPVYDCFYIALAESREIELLTADNRLIAKMADSRWQSLLQDWDRD